MEVDKTHQDKLEEIKTNVRRSYDYFRPNYDRYNEFRRFVFEKALTDDEITLLANRSMPQLEFNILEAYISRLLGEFYKQEPDIEVSADDPTQANPIIIKLMEMNLRHVLTDSKNKHTQWEVYRDLLSGGFSALKFKIEYAHEMSFDYAFDIERVFDPTLVGFDQLARYAHKGDGRFCFELFPMGADEFKSKFPGVSIDRLQFHKNFGGFNWSYTAEGLPYLIVADYYAKDVKQEEIVLLSNKQTMLHKEYKDELKKWSSLQAPPKIMSKRKTSIESICRYRCIESQVLEYDETDFKHFPLIFVDGNSILNKTTNNGNIQQVTRPYVYHAKGAQRLKNYAGIAWANEIENTVQHKFMVAKEALPAEEDFLDAYKDVQKASVVVYNSIHQNNPDQPIANPIREIQRVPAPPEIMGAFTASDSLIQNILGSYDAALGINNNQLSGVALVEAATQSNATAMPYLVGYLHGYSRAAEIYVDMYPKYNTTKLTIPIKMPDGKKSYVKINTDDGIPMFYDANALNVVVKAGNSFQVQKSKTIMMVKEMMGMSPLFGQFIAEKGLPFILDNMEGKGIDELKQLVDGWLKEMQQQKQMTMQAQQQEMMNNPAILKTKTEMAKLQQNAVKDEKQFQIDMAQLQLDEKKVLADIQMTNSQSQVQLVKANTERFAKTIDLALQHKDMGHKHMREAIETHHLVHQPISHHSEQGA